MADCPHCNKKYPDSYLKKHIFEKHSLAALAKRAEAKITPDKIISFITLIKSRYPNNVVTDWFHPYQKT